MKVLVGIMYCIENEFEQCIESIKKQTYKEFDYFVVEKLPNKKAHDQLYRTFMENSDNYELFVKVDADMVLARDTFFEEVVEYFNHNPETDDLQISVYDYFTNRLIYGLHIYSRRMKWNQDNENIFVEWPEFHQKYKSVDDNICLAPAAFHYPNPSKFQAFHYGLHKAIKITQYGRNNLRHFAYIVHWDNAFNLIKNFQNKNDITLALAIIGAFEGIKKKLAPEVVNIDNEIAISTFQKWDSMQEDTIISKAK